MPLPRKASSGFALSSMAVLMAVVGALVLLAGVLTYRSYREQVRRDIGALLEAVAELKAQELSHWRLERGADARFFSENRAFAGLVRQALLDGDAGAAADIRTWFDRMRAGDRYAQIVLVDLDGTARVALSEEALTEDQLHGATTTFSAGHVEWVDFHRDSPDGAVHLAVFAPIIDTDGTPLGTVSLVIDPHAYLYPFLHGWPVPSSTSETFIARRDGDDALYLSPLRSDASATLKRRIPMSRGEVPAVRGALGHVGLFEGVDYRDAPVVAAARSVPSSPWVLVARMDPDEAWAPVRERFWHTVIIGLLALLAVGGGLTTLWQRSRATADMALRENERRYRALFDANPQPMWVYDIETLRFLAVNDAAVSHYGWTRDQFLAMTIADIRPAEDLPHLREDFAQTVHAGIDYAGLWRHFTADGSLIDVEIVAHALDFGGRRAELVLAHDVTERLRAERENARLHEDFAREHASGAMALARLKALIEASPTILYTLAADDPGYPATWVSDNITRILGYTAADALSPGWWRANLHPDDRDRTIASNAKLSQQQTLVQEYRFRDARGRYRVIHDELRLAITSDQRPEVVGAWTDLTEQREGEARQRLQLSALEAAANAIIVTSADGVIEWANPAFAALTGYTLAESVGRTPGELLHSGRHDAAFFRAMWDTVKAGGVWHGELINKRKDGTLYDEEMTITPVRDESGAIAHFVAVKQGITERKQMQEQFLQAQRMESVGRLAGGVAHDFNNLLTVINSYAELAIDDLADDHPLRPSLIEIHKAGERAAGLTRQLLAFSRKQVLQPQQIDLTLIVSNMEKMLRRLLGEDVELVVESDTDPTVVRADQGQIEQVLMNLAVNSRDAMPTGGTLRIAIRHAYVDEQLAAEHPGLIPGTWIMMTVSDDGVGMSAETRERAFEPFFTTKAIGQGTGLGLPTVFGIVQQSGGVIWVDSAPGEGATFTICLPDIGGTAAGHAGHSPMPLAKGTETILIVEDDDMLRDLTKHVLAVSGYDAHAASSGDNALLLLEQLGRPVDLLLTDVVMPGMTGRELAERVHERWPATKVLFMSGYTDDAIVRHGVLDGQARLLNKPFTRAQVLSIVRDVLDEK